MAGRGENGERQTAGWESYTKKVTLRRQTGEWKGCIRVVLCPTSPLIPFVLTHTSWMAWVYVASPFLRRKVIEAKRQARRP